MTHFGVNEGLAGTVIDAIDQTSDGFLCGVRRFRERRGLTQAALAKRLGSSQSRVAKIEAGDASVSIDLMIKSLFGIGARTSDIAALIRSGRSARSA
jgi:ribosome-binding protein aMBF1 (putative translation factor)